MVDVFISYRQDERERMQPIADGLRALKVEVWFDERLTPGKSFTEEIDEVIRECRAQLVCWSPGSVRSDWVRGEADIGRRRGVLVAAMIERCEPPPPFNMLHAEDLSGWAGVAHHPGWHKIIEAIGSKLGRPGLAELSQLQSSADAKAWGRWAQKYRDDPFADEAWAKAEELEIGATRARLAQDRAAAPETQAKEERQASQVSPQISPARPGLNRLTFGILTAAVLAVVIIIVVFIVARQNPPVASSPSVTPPFARPSSATPPAPVPPAPTPPAPTPPSIVSPTKPAVATRPVAPPSAAPAAPPRTVAPPDPAVVARRALDQITPRDWTITPSEVLARRVLETTPAASLEAAAAAGHAPAQVLLGAAHRYGIGDVQKDEAEAVRLFRLAAAQADARGQDALGAMYANGRGGLTKDEVEAVRLYRLSAAQGNASGQDNLGVMYAIGRGGLTKDEVEAVRLYRIAVAQGRASGQRRLAFMYENGRGVAADRAEAVRLYQLAARQGDSTAQNSLRRLGETW